MKSCKLLGALVVCLTMAMAGLASAQRFVRAPMYSQGDTGRDAVAEDFNGDGNPDLAFLGDSYPGTVTIRLGKGDGTFTKGQTLTLDQNDHGQRIVSADLNGDGHPDLAVTSFIYNHVFLLFGSADGTFTVGPTLDPREEPCGIAVGDMNGDGIPDLVTANNYMGSVSVLLGLGDGQFAAAKVFTVGETGTGVTLGDFDGDGRLDVASLCIDVFGGTGMLAVSLGNGDGSLGRAEYYSTAYEPYSVVAGDFNHDGVLDLAVAGGTIAVHLGNGDGTFAPEQLYAASPSNSYGMVAADVNGDGNLDLLAAGFTRSSTVAVLLGKTDGTFKAASLFGTGPCAITLAVADFNRDGKLDAAVPETSETNFSLLLGDGTGKFVTRREFSTATDSDRLNPTLVSLATAYFDADKNLDLVVVDKTNDQVILLGGNKNGAFLVGQKYRLKTKLPWVTAADVNSDGKADVVTADIAANAVSVLLGNGDGTLQNQVQYTTAPAPEFVVSGDVNGDGRPDILTASSANGSFSVLVNTGTGFAKHVDYATPAPHQLALADFNGDGKLDVVTVSGAGTGEVFLGNGGGTFVAGVTLSAGSSPVSVAAGDVNMDGQADVVIANNGSATLSVFLGNGDGTFRPQISTSAVSDPHLALLRDFDGDGKLDAITVNGHDSATSSVALYLGKGDGKFQGAQFYTVNQAPFAAAIGDFNSDGAPDVATANDTIPTVSILLNAGKK